VKGVAEDFQSEKKRKILEWLSGDYNARHEELTRITVENSGLWFLKSSEFKDWMEGRSPSCLICSGIRSSVFSISLTLIISWRRQINLNVSELL